MSDHDDLMRKFDELLERARVLGDLTLFDEFRRRMDQLAPTAASAAAASAAAEAAEARANDPDAWYGLVGTCQAMLDLRRLIEKFAPAQAPVLITGESGTGKERVAHALHALSRRADKPLVAENCAAIPDSLLESVLFGHVKGAFTGAVKDHPGHFVAAHGGTLFLDEIGDMKLPMQVKLLRVLQEGEVRPVGGSKVRKVDVRVIAATNSDLENAVRQGRFREDLYFRLNVLRLSLPPLRDRGEDKVLLARRFLAGAAERAGRAIVLSAAAEEAIRQAAWPGNVRQLQNEMQRIAALGDGPEARPEDLSAELRA
ncbi:MAG: sigma-54 interaction domain-containing protein [Planctomycetota bacterium]